MPVNEDKKELEGMEEQELVEVFKESEEGKTNLIKENTGADSINGGKAEERRNILYE